MTTEFLTPEQLLTSYQVSKLLQVNPTSVNKWIKDERLKAFRTPGGPRRIQAMDLVAFLEEHQMPLPKELGKAGKTRLLICDDDSQQLSSMERMLKTYSSQLEVRLVSSGIDALVQVGAFQPDIVLLDIFMDELDGIEVCRRLKENSETAHIKVIIASGRLDEILEDQARDAGASQCLEKPVNLDLLLQALRLASTPMTKSAH